MKYFNWLIGFNLLTAIGAIGVCVYACQDKSPESVCDTKCVHAKHYEGRIINSKCVCLDKVKTK